MMVLIQFINLSRKKRLEAKIIRGKLATFDYVKKKKKKKLKYSDLII
ncbi:hypothetical protein ACMBCN_01220 [Candidatus Liberibacter asiaticus]|nr:hypothetical protein [Candidatus Liberibacter asiaticus]